MNTNYYLVLTPDISCFKEFPVQTPTPGPGISVGMAQVPPDNLIFLSYPPEYLAHCWAYADLSDGKMEKHFTMHAKTLQDKLRKKGHLSNLVRRQKATLTSLEYRDRKEFE